LSEEYPKIINEKKISVFIEMKTTNENSNFSLKKKVYITAAL
jgi:hypothetical protein